MEVEILFLKKKMKCTSGKLAYKHQVTIFFPVEVSMTSTQTTGEGLPKEIQNLRRKAMSGTPS